MKKKMTRAEEAALEAYPRDGDRDLNFRRANYRIAYERGYVQAEKDIISLIDSLQQEQPEADFKIEERKWVHNAVDNIFPEDGDFMSEIDFRKILKDTAHHFYELGLNARKEE